MELGFRPRQRDFPERFPQGRHPRGLQRGRPARHLVQDLPVLGLGVPGAARPRRQRQRGGHPDHPHGERGVGTRLRRDRADRTVLRRAVTGTLADPAALLAAWESAEAAPAPARGAVLPLAVGLAPDLDAALDLPLGEVAVHAARMYAQAFGPAITGAAAW